MIAYELIVPSASRPHLLGPGLKSLFAHIDCLPARVIVHDDAVFPGRKADVEGALDYALPAGVPVIIKYDDPPLSHGPSLHWLLSQVSTEYVLYTQDDLEVVRDIPLASALGVMHQNDIHQIRFNKRATMEWKRTWQKKEYPFARPDGTTQVLTVSDHWYFQTGLWRVARIKPVVDFLMLETGDSFRERCEVKINDCMNRKSAEFNHRGPRDYALPPSAEEAMVQEIRRDVQRTFIWGRIGEDRYVNNLGFRPEDWALLRARGGVGGPRDSQAQL